jgi:hypothetical protein
MKKTIFILSALYCSMAISQETLKLKAEDGTEFEVDILNKNPDEGRNAEVYLGAFGIDGVHILGANYNIPKIANINLGIGVNNYWLDGSVFAYSWIKNGKIKQSVGYNSTGINNMGQSTVQKYVAKIPSDKRRSIGLHGGFNSFSFLMSKEGTTRLDGMSWSAGLTFLRAMHVHWGIKENGSTEKGRQGTLINKFHADYVGYFNQSVSSISTHGFIEPQPLSYYTRNSGFRIYLDGKATFWSEKGRISVHYMAGIAQGAEALKSIDVLFGLGVGFNFL